MQQLVETKYLPATSSKGSRIRVRGTGGTKFYAFTYSSRDEHPGAARRYAEEVLGATFMEEIWHSDECPVRYFIVAFTKP